MPDRDQASPPAPLPQGLVALIRWIGGWHQIALSVLTVALFLLSVVPLELQRRIIDDSIHRGLVRPVVLAALAYAGVATLDGALKLGLNIYRSWVSEHAVRRLRGTIQALLDQARRSGVTAIEGTQVSMVVAEAEPIGGFIGVSLSEPLLQIGVVGSVLIYLASLQPMMAAVSVALMVPQTVFIPLLQNAINRRARARVQILREVGSEIISGPGDQAHETLAPDGRINQVFHLNMVMLWLKYVMNFLMNQLTNMTVASMFALGSLYAIRGDIDVGTIVAFVSGLAKITDPIGDLVNWYRDLTTTIVRYRLITDTIDPLMAGSGATIPPDARA